MARMGRSSMLFKYMGPAEFAHIGSMVEETFKPHYKFGVCYVERRPYDRIFAEAVGFREDKGLLLIGFIFAKNEIVDDVRLAFFLWEKGINFDEYLGHAIIIGEGYNVFEHPYVRLEEYADKLKELVTSPEKYGHYNSNIWFRDHDVFTPLVLPFASYPRELLYEREVGILLAVLSILG